MRWKYGIPPKGNANCAWVQHFIHHLSPTGFAGFVLANGSMSSTVLAPLHSPPDDLVYPLSVVMPLRSTCAATFLPSTTGPTSRSPRHRGAAPPGIRIRPG